MKWICMVFAICMLCGCGHQPVWETVNDQLPTEALPVGQDITYKMQADALQNLQVMEEQGNDVLYLSGNTEILTTTFLAYDYKKAVEQISGFSAERLDILKTTRSGVPEYQFAWFSQTEEGGKNFRADLIMDGMNCYAVVCSAPEEDKTFYEQTRQVFSVIG